MNKSLFFIKFSVNFNFKIDIDYNFQDWTHAKIDISFFKKTSSKKSCLDIDANFALMNWKFFKIQTSEIFIRIIIIFITIRDLNIDKHIINKYVIVFIIFIKKNNKENDIRVMFRRETHIMNNLKINIFMKNEIINFKKIFIDFDKNIARINNCNVIIFIKMRNFNKTIFKSVHLQKIIIISSRSKISILMHHFDMSNSRDFLFELNKIFYIIVYVHVIDIIINAMILRNDFDKLIQISRNHRFDQFSELNFSNVFKIDVIKKNDVYDLAVKHSKFIH